MLDDLQQITLAKKIMTFARDIFTWRFTLLALESGLMLANPTKL
jgi:hypothetical protein